MTKTQKPDPAIAVDPKEVDYFIERLIGILMRQVEENAFEKQGEIENETRKARQSA